MRPKLMISLGVVVSTSEPFAVRLASNLLRIVVGHDHRGEKWRLRAREVIRTIGVEHGAVMLNFEESVLDHVARHREFAVAYKSADDEIAVPTVHLVKATARDHVRVGQVEQPRLNLGSLYVSQTVNYARQLGDASAAFRFDLLHGSRNLNIRGNIEN